MRRLLPLTGAALLLIGSAASSAPEFAPSAQQAYDGFVGINPPRADVPIGALWIDRYGPTGEPASADNLETVRGLSSITVDKNLQLAVSLGVLNLFGIDPRARDHYVARFTDLSIVRVKDVARLAGPKGEPRIVEAIKAGSVIVTSDSEMGLNGRSLAAGAGGPVDGSGTSGRSRAYSMEARDMVIAIRVATPEIIKGKERELRIVEDKPTRLDDFLLLLSQDHCAKRPSTSPSTPASTPPSPCLPNVGIAKINTQTVSAVRGVPLDPGKEARLELPVPVADGEGGLYDSLVVRWVPPCSVEKVEGCRRYSGFRAHYEGRHLKDSARIDAKGW